MYVYQFVKNMSIDCSNNYLWRELQICCTALDTMPGPKVVTETYLLAKNCILRNLIIV